MNLPEAVRQGVWRATASLREVGLPVKWVAPDGMHLTVKFLGEVDDAREPALIAALAQAVGAGPEPRDLVLQVQGFGAFPDAARPRVIWAGVTAEPALELLQDRVERGFAALGFALEGRPFRPHLTLGRAKRDARPQAFAGLEARLAALDFSEATSVATLDLMQSTLQAGGAVYHVKHRERLS